MSQLSVLVCPFIHVFVHSSTKPYERGAGGSTMLYVVCRLTYKNKLLKTVSSLDEFRVLSSSISNIVWSVESPQQL